MTNRHIVITGFMGSGKTTVARELARTLGCSSWDLDELVTHSQQRSPQEIIEQDGEDKFREIETHELAELLMENACVVALGGGTWTIPENRKLLAEYEATTIWLDAPFELCWKRIEAIGGRRPLAPSYEVAKRRYHERLSSYELADFRVPVRERESVGQLAGRIAESVLRDGASR